DRIGSGAIDSFVCAFDATEKISAADNDRNLNAARRDILQISRDPRENVVVKPMAQRAHQGFAGKFDNNPLPGKGLLRGSVCTCVAHGFKVVALPSANLQPRGIEGRGKIWELSPLGYV